MNASTLAGPVMLQRCAHQASGADVRDKVPPRCTSWGAVQLAVTPRVASLASRVGELSGLRRGPGAASLNAPHKGLVQARSVQVAEQTSEHRGAAQAQQPEGRGVGLRSRG